MKKHIFFTFSFLVCILSSSFSQMGFNVDVLPTNVGGKAEFKRVFDQELIYPQSSLKKKIGGEVTFNFTVLKDSTLADIVESESGAPDINVEAMRIFKLFQWVPAIKGGQYVSTKWSVSFTFNPDKYAKICRERGFQKFQYPPKSIIDSTGKIYTKPEQFPMYIKGNYALQDLIKENLEYPRQAQLSNIQGTVMLSFIVEPSGLMTNIGIEKSVNGGCDQEAIRVLQMIKWYPGKNEGKLVRAKMSFPFYFILNDEFRDNAAGEQK
jgi:TonB family protein